uniref:Retroviral polymerase SH3-like domain-containing protein n=1 Tax=Cajanus cajan TaxID=3821 RepID=A0A151QTJ2_CAJCA|nr:hypothetical protein KK1_045582 [Cajanus cajan]
MSISEKFVQPVIPRFDGHYDFWCMTMLYFLGVSDESKAYKLFDPKTKKVIVSSDVVFEEDKNCDDNSTVPESTSNSKPNDVSIEGRDTRTRRQPIWLTDYETNLLVEENSLVAMMMIDFEDSHSFEEACTSQKWREAMCEEERKR